MIGIIGKGIVGNAIYEFFKNNEIIKCYDKYKRIGKLEDVLICDILFLCLPTPFESKEYNKKQIYDICEKLRGYQGLVVIKSTVEPGTCRHLYNTYNLKIIHNPEFLSTRTANQDFINQNHIVIGSQIDVSLLVKLYNKYFNCEISICSWEESECMKLFVNSFYATKIQFFNELYELCQQINCDYNIIRKLMLKNGWIHEMHTLVPGTDGKKSYGGLCFPKDTQALLQFMKRNNTSYKVLESVIEERNKMREEI